MKDKPLRPAPGGRPERLDADAIAIQALGALAGSPERLGGFLALTGLSPQSMRDVACDPGFLAAILDYVTADEVLLREIAGETGISPEDYARAREQIAARDAPPAD